MSIDSVLTNHIVFRWDEESKRLLVTDASPVGGGPPKSIAQVEYRTLAAMSHPDAARFIGEFVTLLVPELRAMYAAEFKGTEDSSGGERNA